MLLAFGADILVVDNKNQGAMDIAQFYGQEGVCKFLASKGFK